VSSGIVSHVVHDLVKKKKPFLYPFHMMCPRGQHQLVVESKDDWADSQGWEVVQMQVDAPKG
jgi:hypothetical protein